MKFWIILAGTLSGCAAAPLPEPPIPPPIVIASAPSVPTAPVASVVQAYRAAESKEVPQITADNVTADAIRRIHDADIAARHALTRLGNQGKHPTPAALAAARGAVKALEDALTPSSPGPSAEADRTTGSPP
jgi:hypothetical protein